MSEITFDEGTPSDVLVGLHQSAHRLREGLFVDRADESDRQVASYYIRLGFPAAPDDRFKISARAHEVVDAIGEQLEEETTLETILRRKPNEVVTIDPDAPITEALTLLNDTNIASVVVSRDGDAIDGILSERDIVVGIHTHGAALLEGCVRDHMTTNPTTADVSTVIADVMEIVTLRRLRHLPVTEGGKLTGIISVGDLLVFRMHEHDMRRDVLPYRSGR